MDDRQTMPAAGTTGRSHEHGHQMGREVDGVLSRKFGAYLTVLSKVAWYDDGGRFSPRDTTKYWVETTVAF